MSFERSTMIVQNHRVYFDAAWEHFVDGDDVPRTLFPVFEVFGLRCRFWLDVAIERDREPGEGILLLVEESRGIPLGIGDIEELAEILASARTQFAAIHVVGPQKVPVGHADGRD